MQADQERLHALDAVRAFALLLGIVLHATMSFMPGLIKMGWPIADNSPSKSLEVVFFVIHVFRMTAFFVMAGFFAHLLFHRRGANGFIRDRAKRVVVPFVVGWLVLAPIIMAIMFFAATKHGAPMTPPAPPAGQTLVFPLMHLWFLYVLSLLYMCVLAVRAVLDKLDAQGRLRHAADRFVGFTTRAGLAPLMFALPVSLALAFHPNWQPFGGIPTPDMSLIPNLPAFVAYSTAFVFGWLLHRQTDLLGTLQRAWIPYAVAAVIAIFATMFFIGTPGRFPLAASAFAYGIASWVSTFAIIAAAMRFLSVHRPAIRYLADSSYWLYLLHLPLVFGLQFWMADWPLHWGIKYPLILAITTLLLLVSYHWLVRSTFIGEVLNGRRYPRGARAGSTVAAPSVASGGDAPLARLRDVRKRYGNTVALDGLDLDVRRGELVAVLGPNGAGKSTAIALLLGLQRPDSGEVRLFGELPESLEARRQTGVMMQEVALAPELRVRELIALTASYYAAPLTAEAAMEMTQTTALADRFYRKLSGGQKRQVQFAMAICGRPQLLFLDEPTVGLDVSARETMWNAIRSLVRGGCSIVLTTHYLEEAESLADRVVVVAKGKVIASGSVADMRSLVSRRRIECVTRLPVEELEQWGEIDSVTSNAGRIHITTANAESVVRRLLAIDPTLSELEVRRAGLSEAFTELTQEAA